MKYFIQVKRADGTIIPGGFTIVRLLQSTQQVYESVVESYGQILGPSEDFVVTAV